MKRYEVPGHVDFSLSPKWFVREGKFSHDEIEQLRRIRKAVRSVFPQDKKTLRPVVYTLHVEETEIGFFQCRVETATRRYWFSQPTLPELALDVEQHLEDYLSREQ